MLFAHAIEPKAVAVSVAVRAVPASLLSLGDNTPDIIALQQRAAKIGRTELPILIQGETGTGKEFLARAIHESSGVCGPFVAINCAAIPESLIESELFGYSAGAFTGAAPKGRKGLIEHADRGTLFLDEIGDMPLTLQSRLLRVLAEREIQPVGALAPKPVRIRVISASHRDLADMVAAGAFREDLYYRLKAAVLRLPPLRERADFDWILQRFLKKYAISKDMMKVTDRARTSLKAYDWPGNIRELENVVATAVALTETGTIDVDDLPDEFSGRVATLALPRRLPTGSADASAVSLRAMLDICHGNISEVARRMGVDRTTIHRRIRRLDIKPPRESQKN